MNIAIIMINYGGYYIPTYGVVVMVKTKNRHISRCLNHIKPSFYTSNHIMMGFTLLNHHVSMVCHKGFKMIKP